MFTFLSKKLNTRYPVKSVKNATQNPRTLSRLTVINGYFDPTEHFVSQKVDGKTALIFKKGEFLYGVIDGSDPIIMKELVGEDTKFDDVVEGEYIEEQKRVIVHDIITMNTTYDIIVAELPRVVDMINSLQTKISASTKPIKKVASIDDIYESYKENLDFENDGLIFTNQNPTRNRIYKWKDASKLTIDLVCMRTDGASNNCVLLAN